MKCGHCHKSIDEDSNFCKYCGIPVTHTMKEQTKTFAFDDYSRNKGNLKEINTWLKTNQIRISNIRFKTFVNRAVINSELVIGQLKIEYFEVETKGHYHMNGFSSYTWNPRQKNDFVKLEHSLDEWTEKNPGKNIVWKDFAEQTDEEHNQVNQAVFFMYMIDGE